MRHGLGGGPAVGGFGGASRAMRRAGFLEAALDQGQQLPQLLALAAAQAAHGRLLLSWVQMSSTVPHNRRPSGVSRTSVARRSTADGSRQRPCLPAPAAAASWSRWSRSRPSAATRSCWPRPSCSHSCRSSSSCPAYSPSGRNKSLAMLRFFREIRNMAWSDRPPLLRCIAGTRPPTAAFHESLCASRWGRCRSSGRGRCRGRPPGSLFVCFQVIIVAPRQGQVSCHRGRPLAGGCRDPVQDPRDHQGFVLGDVRREVPLDRSGVRRIEPGKVSWPADVSRTQTPRPSSPADKRSTNPDRSSRSTRRVIQLRLSSADSASSLIRRVCSGASQIRMRTS